MDFLDIAKFAALKASRRFANIDSEAREDMVSEAICAVLEQNPSTAQEVVKVAYRAAAQYGYHWIMGAGLHNHGNVTHLSSLETAPQRFLVQEELDEEPEQFHFDRYEKVLRTLLMKSRKRKNNGRSESATQNEIEVLKLIIEGYSNQIIADKMSMKVGAIKTMRLRLRLTLSTMLIKYNRCH